MKILIGCEFSQTVCKAFRDKGHEAFSCDILPTEGNPDWHIQGNVLEVLDDGWDLGIFHPPCTYLSNAGIAWFNVQRYGQKAIDRWYKRIESFDFFMQLMNAPIEKICVENPVGFPNSAYRKPNQIIHPYYFGEREMKRTCLWLKNLPNLWYWMEDDLFGNRTAAAKPEPVKIQVRQPSEIFNGGEQKNRYFTDRQGNVTGHERSYTFTSIAAAMANQWG